MTDDKLDLDELERLEREATKGPWRWVDYPEPEYMPVDVSYSDAPSEAWLYAIDELPAKKFADLKAVIDYAGCGSHGCEVSPADRAFIAALRNAAPRLFERVRQAEAEAQVNAEYRNLYDDEYAKNATLRARIAELERRAKEDEVYRLREGRRTLERIKERLRPFWDIDDEDARQAIKIIIDPLWDSFADDFERLAARKREEK